MGTLRRAPFAQVPGSLRQEMGIARCGHEALSDCCRGGGQTHALNEFFFKSLQRFGEPPRGHRDVLVWIRGELLDMLS